jgi:mono/diheme cytochrome c family protein
MKYFFLVFAALVLTIVLIAGLRDHKSPNRPFEFFPDMDHQPKVKAQTESRFFADGIGPRAAVPGTVPLGWDIPAKGAAGRAEPQQVSNAYSAAPDYYNTGKMGDRWGDGLPVPVTAALMKRGQERYAINCQICHGASGAGNGITSKYGWVGIANYHEQRFVDMPDGQIFNTLTNGKDTMLGYGGNIPVADRWAIVAYIRALQKAQLGRLADLTPEQQAKLK